MYYKLIDNNLIIFYTNGKIKENATQENKECAYCLKDNDCDRPEKKRGGSGCDGIRCILEERI